MPVDYAKYPPDWKSAIVPRILERAGDCCEFCGVANKAEVVSVPMYLPVSVPGPTKFLQCRRVWLSGESDVARIRPWLPQDAAGGVDVKRVRVVLTVAHLDHDEGNAAVSDDRLAALCQWCHLNYDAPEKARRAVNKFAED